MKKRKIQIIVGIIVGLCTAFVGLIPAYYEDVTIPMSILIINYIIGAVSACVIIYAFFRFYW